MNTYMQAQISMENSTKISLLKIESSFRSRGIHPLDELTKNSNTPFKDVPKDEQLHFPENDVIDTATGCQYFFHRHSSETSDDSIHIHFFRRWRPEELNLPEGETIPTHLAALEFDATGTPVKWFATNQWVTADYWIDAPSTIDLFKGWRIDAPERSASEDIHELCHEWLRLLLMNSLESEITELLESRDLKLDCLVDLNPGINPLEDRRFEILSEKLFVHTNSVRHY